ncbi:MAG TPA: Si-specific NAD(P)(+) transhydrogenase [Candidatus Binatia bacterium]|jgi:NAD(P) transhydrogenase|nr:Si-specific NAD(P)(+) transhydrogenase [Candidatus Binatia bacterium]
MSPAFDVLVLGSGPAGEKAAIQAAKLGKRVGVIEKPANVGGSCLHRGTIPSKTLREAIVHLVGAKQRAINGMQVDFGKRSTLETLRGRTRAVIQSQTDRIERHFDRNDVTLFQGTARFCDPHRLEVLGPDGGRCEVTSELIIIATGSRPAHDPHITVDHTVVRDSDSILALDALPRRLTIVGAGVIGCEYACMFAAIGVKVTLVDCRPRVLEFVDHEMSELLVARMRDQGIIMRLGEEVADVKVDPPGRVAATTRSGKVIIGDMLLYAVGRQGNTEELALANAGLVPAHRGLLEVNDCLQTSVPHIYAVGDVIGFPSLAATATHQGRLAVAHACGLAVRREGTFAPYGVYTIPELSMVGDTEEQLTAARVNYEIGHAYYREIARGEISGERLGMLKLLFERDTHRLRGVHIVGASASDLIHIGQAVLSFGGPVDYFVDTVFNYPTLSEAYRVAALNGLNRL